MGTKNFLTVAAILIAALFSSCGNDDAPLTNNGQVALRASATIDSQPKLKVAGTSWQAGDAIGIFMLQGTTEKASNRKYATNAGDGNFAPSDANQTIYFPVENNAPKMDFTAYYPYSGAQSGLTYAISLADQSNQAALDLLTADKVTGKDKTSPAVAFSFKHRLVKMELALKAGTGLTTASLTGMSVSLSGQYTEGECDLNTGAATVSGNTGIIGLITQSDGAWAEATLLPAAASEGRVLAFTLATGEIFRYEIPSDRAFNAGEKHSYAITLNRTGVSVTADITDWLSVPGTGVAK